MGSGRLVSGSSRSFGERFVAHISDFSQIGSVNEINL